MEEPMATLNVKNLPDPLYRKLQARARRQRRSLAQEVIHLLTQAVEEADSPASVWRAAWTGSILTYPRGGGYDMVSL